MITRFMMRLLAKYAFCFAFIFSAIFWLVSISVLWRLMLD